MTRLSCSAHHRAWPPKIGSSEPASGLSLAGPTGTSDTYVILQAKGTESSLKLRNEDRRERVVEP
jgi:hypothetical protein